MAKYLAGQMGPLTPSQEPTNVAHLVKYKPEPKRGTCTDGSTLSESFSLKTPKAGHNRQDNVENACPSNDVSMATINTEPSNNFCLIM